MIEEEVKRGGPDGGASKTQEAGTLLKIPMFEEDRCKRENPWCAVTTDGAPCGDLLFDFVFASEVEEREETQIRDEGIGWIHGMAGFEVGEGALCVAAFEQQKCKPQVKPGRRVKRQTLLVIRDSRLHVSIAFRQPACKFPPLRHIFPLHRLQSPAATLEIARLHGPLRLRQIHGRDNWHGLLIGLLFPNRRKFPGRRHWWSRQKQQPKSSGQCQHSQKSQHRNPDPLASVHPVLKKSQNFHSKNGRRVSR
jgi:hypothetical protein